MEKFQQLVYRGPDGVGGFRTGKTYDLRVGFANGERCLYHPVTKEPWMTQPPKQFWETWERVAK